MTPILEARGVTRRYGSHGKPVAAIEEVSVSVGKGAFAVMTGPSGSGKSTLLSILGAIERPSAGSVLFDGQDVVRVSDAERTRVRRRIGFVFQGFPMIRRLAVWENITYPLVPLGVATAARRARAEALLAKLGISGLIDKRPETLSGGECQRVGLARALVSDPAAILADEPTSNLDPKSAEAIALVLAGLHAAGTTILVATHDPRLMSLATQTIALDSGRTVQFRA